MIGFLCIDKKKGDTSAYVVNRIKKLTKCACGHMGTLDPLASGVLPVGIGQATRMFSFLLDKKKSYVADFDFSFTTPSLDLETEIVERSDKKISLEAINEVIPELCGTIMQIPPVFSAKCVDGKRSYKLARRGVSVDLPPKEVTIEKIAVVKQNSESNFTFRIDCLGGTYIRSIVRDMGNLLGACGTMTDLRRTSSGIFDVEKAVTLEKLFSPDCRIEDYIVPPENTVFYPRLDLTEVEEKRLLNGLYDNFSVENGVYKVFGVNGFLGVGEVTDKKLKMKAYVRDLK